MCEDAGRHLHPREDGDGDVTCQHQLPVTRSRCSGTMSGFPGPVATGTVGYGLRKKGKAQCTPTKRLHPVAGGARGVPCHMPIRTTGELWGEGAGEGAGLRLGAKAGYVCTGGDMAWLLLGRALGRWVPLLRVPPRSKLRLSTSVEPVGLARRWMYVLVGLKPHRLLRCLSATSFRCLFWKINPSQYDNSARLPCGLGFVGYKSNNWLAWDEPRESIGRLFLS